MLYSLPRRPRCQLISLRPQFCRRLAQTLEASLDRVAGSAVRVKRRAIHAVEVGLDQSNVVQDIEKPAGRLEGTHAFLRNHLPEARTHRRFLNQIDITAEEHGEPLAQSLQPAKMIKSPGREPCTRPDRQIHVGHPICVAARERAKQRDRLDAARSELRLMRPKNSQQLGTGSWMVGHVQKSNRNAP